MPPRPAPVAGWRSRAEARFVGRQPPAACNTGTLLRRRWSADNKARILRRRWRHLQQGPDDASPTPHRRGSLAKQS